MQDSLNQMVDENVFTNGYGLVTANNLGLVLKAMNGGLNRFMHFAGEAKKDTVPDTGDLNIYYVAMEGGEYPNFGFSAVPQGLNYFMRHGSMVWKLLTVAVEGTDLGDIANRVQQAEQMIVNLGADVVGLENWVSTVGSALVSDVSTLKQDVTDVTTFVTDISDELSGLKVEVSDHSQRIDTLEGIEDVGKLRVVQSDGVVSVFSPIGDGNDLVRRFDIGKESSQTQNGVITPIDIRTVVAGSEEPLSGSLIREVADNTPLYFINQSYFGGQFSYRWPCRITLSSHGKTFADIGSSYTSAGTGTRKYTIVRIEDANNFIVIPEQTGEAGTVSHAAPSGNLTYIAGTGGVNTGTVSGYSWVRTGDTVNLTTYGMHGFCVIKDKGVKVDNVNSVESGEVVKCSHVDIYEKFAFLDMENVRSKVADQRPIGGYTENPSFFTLGASEFFEMENTYRVLKEGVTLVISSITPKTKINITNTVVQIFKLYSSDVAKLRIPNTKSFSVGGNTYDLANGVDVSSALSIPGKVMTPDTWIDPTKLLEREIIEFTNTNYNAQIGSVPDFGIMEKIHDNPEHFQRYSGSINFTPAAYFNPRLSGLATDGDYGPGETIDMASFSQWGLRPVGGLMNKLIFEFRNRLYVYLDFKGEFSGSVDLPKKYLGASITKISKSDNITVDNVINSGSLRLNSTAGNGFFRAIIDLGKEVAGRAPEYLGSKLRFEEGDMSGWKLGVSKLTNTYFEGDRIVQILGRDRPIVTSDYLPIDARKAYYFWFNARKNPAVSGNVNVATGVLYFDVNKKPINIVDPAQSGGQILPLNGALVSYTLSNTTFARLQGLLVQGIEMRILPTQVTPTIPQGTHYVKFSFACTGANIALWPTAAYGIEFASFSMSEAATMQYSDSLQIPIANIPPRTVIFDFLKGTAGIKIGGSGPAAKFHHFDTFVLGMPNFGRNYLNIDLSRGNAYNWDLGNATLLNTVANRRDGKPVINLYKGEFVKFIARIPVNRDKLHQIRLSYKCLEPNSRVRAVMRVWDIDNNPVDMENLSYPDFPAIDNANYWQPWPYSADWVKGSRTLQLNINGSTDQRIPDNAVFVTLEFRAENPDNPASNNWAQISDMDLYEIPLGEAVPNGMSRIPAGQMVYNTSTGAVGRYDGAVVKWFAMA